MKHSRIKPKKQRERLKRRQREYDRYFRADGSYRRPGSLTK